MNRIKIGDVWYVREDSSHEAPEEEKEELEIILSREITIETDDVLVEGSVLEEGEIKLEPGVFMVEEKKYSMASVDITFKTGDRGKECWDNDAFLAGVAHRDPDSMAEMSDIGDKTKEVVIAVIDKMHELNYI